MPPSPQAPPPYGAPPAPPYGAPPAYPQYDATPLRPQLPPTPPPAPPRPSAWNGPAFGLLAIALCIAGAFLWPQWRARQTERAAKPLVSALAKRDVGVKCPRYINAVFTNVGSVKLDEHGQIADRTDLTGPVCDGLRHVLSPAGTRELGCLTDPAGTCPESARRSVVAISVVAHEAMHLRGQLNEGGAECDSVGESATIATTLGIPLEQARMISWLHYAAMNPLTPPQYVITPESCAPVADLVATPPGTPGSRAALEMQIAASWQSVAS